MGGLQEGNHRVWILFQPPGLIGRLMLPVERDIAGGATNESKGAVPAANGEDVVVAERTGGAVDAEGFRLQAVAFQVPRQEP